MHLRVILALGQLCSLASQPGLDCRHAVCAGEQSSNGMLGCSRLPDAVVRRWVVP